MYICIEIKKDKMDHFFNQGNNSVAIDPFFSQMLPINLNFTYS